MDGPEPDTASVTARVRRYEAVCSTLLALAPIGGLWSEEEHVSLWQRALNRLGSTRSGGGKSIWLRLRRYPAALLLYALGVGAVEANRLGFLARLLEARISDEHHTDEAAVQVLPPSRLFAGNGKAMQILDGMDRHYAPLNDWMHDALRPHAARVVPDDTRYTLVFDKLETLMALAYTHLHSGRDWPPLGAFGHREENRNRIVTEITDSLSSRANDSPFVKCGIFGDTGEVCSQRLNALLDFVGRARWW